MSSISARSLIGCGVNRLAMVFMRIECVAGGIGCAREEKTVSGSLPVETRVSQDQQQKKFAHVKATLNASYAWP